MVNPGDRHLNHLITQASRDSQDLHIKAPAVECLVWKNTFGCRSAETFEAALGILNAGQHQDPHQQVENPPDQVAVKRFTDPF